MKKSEEFFLKNKPKFLFGISDIKQLKNNVNNCIEIAFIGKSNVGKSSLINAVTKSKISISSKTPGRTKEINFFNIANKINLVDMPGYGFAMVKKEQKESWNNLFYDYFSLSKNLKIIFLLIDCRKGITAEDIDFMLLFDSLKINYQIVLTKIDNINKNEVENIINKINNEALNHIYMNKKAIAVSARMNYNIYELQDLIYNLI